MGYDCPICSVSLEEPGEPPQPRTAGTMGGNNNNAAPPPSKRRKQKESSPVASENNGDYAISTPCGHLFHKSCILASSLKTGTNLKCPNCSQISPIQNLTRLYLGLDEDGKKDLVKENLQLRDVIVNQQIRITQLEAQNASLVEAQTLNRDKVSTLQLAKESSEAENVVLQAEISNLKIQNLSLTEASDEIKTKYSDLESQNASLFQAAEDMKKTQSMLESENKRLKAQQINTNIVLASYVLREFELESQTCSLTATELQLKKKYTELEVENEKVTWELNIEKENLKTNQEELSSLTTKSTELNQKYTELHSDYKSIKKELKNKEHDLEIQTLKLQKLEGESKLLLPNAKIMYDHCKAYMEKFGDFAKIFNQGKEEMQVALNNIAADVVQLESENALLQTIANLNPKDKMRLSLDIEGRYDLISYVNFGQYIQAAGILIGESGNNLKFKSTIEAHVSYYGSSRYFIGTYYYYGSFTSSGSYFNLGEIFEKTLEGVFSNKLCKTLITKESETTLKQQQVYNGQIWVTKREFTPTQMIVTLIGPPPPVVVGGRADGITCSLVFKKREKNELNKK